MAALAAAVRPFAGGVLPRCATPAPRDDSEHASGAKPRRVALAPARDSSVCLGGVEELYVASQKRNMACNRNNVETAAADTKVLTVGGEMSAQELLRKRKMTCNRNNVVETAAADTKILTAAAGGMPARELLQKRLASELDVLRGLLKKAELISRRGGACNGGAPAAGNGNKERFLASDQRSVSIEDGGDNAPSVMKRRKISAPVEQRQKKVRAPPRMSAEERRQLACRLSSLSGEVPGHIVEFLLNHVGDADADGEIEIDIDSVEDSVLFELKTQLDKLAPERPIVVDVLPDEKGENLAEKSKSEGILVKQEEEDVHIRGVSTIVQTGSKPSSRSSSGSDKGPSSRSSSGLDKGSYSACERYSEGYPALREALPEQIIATSVQPPSEPAPGTAQSGEAKKAQVVQRAAAPKTVPLAGLIYRAKVRRELMEMEKAVLPDERIHPRDLQRLGIAEYGHPSLMRQLGLVCGLSPIVETGSTPRSSSSSGDSGSHDSDSGNESDSDQIKDMSARQPSEPASGTAQSTVQADSVPGVESIGGPAPATVEVSEVARSGEAKKVQEVQPQRAAPKASVDMPGLLYRANLRRQLLEMERVVLPDQRIDPRDLQRLGIAEYGHPSLMRQLGLILKADDA